MFTVASSANLNAFRNAYPVNFRYSGLTRLPPGIRRQSLLKPDIGPEFSSASIHDGCGKSTRGRSSSRPSARIFRQLLGIIGFASFPLKPWTLWPELAFMLNDRFAASAWMPALGRERRRVAATKPQHRPAGFGREQSSKLTRWVLHIGQERSLGHAGKSDSSRRGQFQVAATAIMFASGQTTM